MRNLERFYWLNLSDVRGIWGLYLDQKNLRLKMLTHSHLSKSTVIGYHITHINGKVMTILKRLFRSFRGKKEARRNDF